jgi:hypothetical protein
LIEAPSQAKIGNVTNPEEVLADLLSGSGIPAHKMDAARALLSSFNKCAKSTIADYVQSDGKRSAWIIEEILLKNSGSGNTAALTQRDVLDAAMLAPIITTFMPHEDIPPSELLDHIEEIGSFYERMYKNKSRAKLIRAYAAAFCTAFDEEHSLEELEYIAEHLEQLAPHAVTIFDRGTMERSFLEQLVNNKTPALSEGIL